MIAAERNGVAGLNVVGLRRAGLGASERAEIKRAFDLLYRSGKNATQAITAAQDEKWNAVGCEFWDFATAAKKKGLCDWLGARRGNVGEV